jgi:hypothetical protein
MMTKKVNNSQQHQKNKRSSGQKKDGYKTSLTCWNCGKEGHPSKECFSLEVGNGMTHRPTGQKDNVKKNKHKNNSSSVAGATMKEISEELYAALVKGKARQHIEWLVDLEASSHICNSKDAFSQMERLKTPKRFRRRFSACAWMLVGVSSWHEDLFLGTRDSPPSYYTIHTSAEWYSREGQQNSKGEDSIHADRCKDGSAVVVPCSWRATFFLVPSAGQEYPEKQDTRVILLSLKQSREDCYIPI